MPFSETPWYKALIALIGAGLLILLAFGSVAYIDTFHTLPKQQNEVVFFNNPVNFTYDVAEVLVDIYGAQLKDGVFHSEITLLNPVILPVDPTILSFIETADLSGDARLGYQLTTKIGQWYYVKEGKWEPVNDCTTCFSSAEEINDQIGNFPISSDELRLRTRLNGTVDASPRLYAIEFIMEGR